MSYSVSEYHINCGSCCRAKVLVVHRTFLGRFGMVSIMSLIKEKIAKYGDLNGVTNIPDHILNDVAELVVSNGSMRWSQGPCPCGKLIVINADCVPIDPCTFNALCIETLVKK